MNRDYAIHVLKLPPVFDACLLRTNYKRMALLLHPDRRTLDPESANQLFSILTDSYKLLKLELETGVSSSERESEADWRAMRSHAKRESEAPSQHQQRDTVFNINNFNNKFADTRLGDENDRGYSSWMERLSPDAAAGQQRKRQEGDRKRVAENANSALAVSEPEAVWSMSSIPHSELGSGRVRDFGSSMDMGRGIQYTDYKVAHMTASCLIDPEIVQARRQFESVQAYEQARAQCSSSSMTEEERLIIKRREDHRSELEQNRLAALRRRDNLVSSHHAKIHSETALLSG